MTDNRSFLQIFMDHIDSEWQWIKGKNKPNGYGTFDVKGKTYLAHRASYELFNGPIPKGMLVLHSCDDPGCVNPEHLHLGDHKMNMQEMTQRGRGAYKKGEKNGYHKLTQEKADNIRNEYSAGNISMRSLGEKYGIGPSHICRIIHNLCWEKSS